MTINYFINQAELTELFCINKDKPQLNCKGKCHLTTQLAAADENKKDEPYAPSGTQVNIELQYIIVNSKIKISDQYSLKKKLLTHNSFGTISEGFYSILSPPPKSKNIIS